MQENKICNPYIYSMEMLFQTKLICKYKKIQAHYLCPGNEVKGNQDEWFTVKAEEKGNSVLGHSNVSALQVKLSTETFSNILDTKYAFIMTNLWLHYNDTTMGAMASQITSLTFVYSNVYSDPDQRKHQSSVSLAFVQGLPHTNGQLCGNYFHLMTSSCEEAHTYPRNVSFYQLDICTFYHLSKSRWCR